MRLINKTQNQVCILGLVYFYLASKNQKKVIPKRRWWVRDIFLKRKDQGAFHFLLMETRLTDTEKYFSCLPMTPKQFDDLLAIIGKTNNRLYHIREPISPAERLAVTLRHHQMRVYNFITNYKGNHSIVLLALCDAKYKFIAIDIGARVRQSDGGVLRYSELGMRLFNDQSDLSPSSCIEDQVIYLIIGDAAFPLMRNLIRPYPGNFLPLNNIIFNYRLSWAKRVSENSFGILVTRWMILKTSIIATLETTQDITKATVSLHNWIMSDTEENRKYCSTKYVGRGD